MTDPLSRFLGSGDALARLHDHARILQRLQAQLREILPEPLCEACSVANLKGDSLILIARSGSIATRVKQMVPSLIQGFSHRGVALGNIQIKVGVAEDEPVAPPREARILGDGGRESLETLIAELPQDAPLRASLQKLLDRSRSR